MIVPCPACGQKNRVSPSRLADGRCGRCQGSLANPAEPLEVDTATFDALMASESRPVLVDFWAAWCGPCRRAAPEVAEAARQLAGRALVLKVDTEANPQLSARFQISGIPWFAVFQRGARVAEQSGLVPAARLVALVPPVRAGGR